MTMPAETYPTKSVPHDTCHSQLSNRESWRDERGLLPRQDESSKVSRSLLRLPFRPTQFLRRPNDPMLILMIGRIKRRKPRQVIRRPTRLPVQQIR